MKSKAEQRAKVKIKVAEFKVSDYRKELDRFGNKGYSYKGRQLFVRYDSGILEKEPKGTFLLAKRKDEPHGSNVVRLTPGLCGSFAIWPPESGKNNNLLEECKDKTLRPQFVFLALNWSNKIQIAGNRAKLSSPADYFSTMPRWNNFHDLLRCKARHQPSRLEEFFESTVVPNPFRGAYMTDFVKGFIAKDSRSVYKFLKQDNFEGTGKSSFEVFVKILCKELNALDKVFGNPNVPKYLVVFGPTLYNNLQYLAKKERKKTFDDFFPDRKIVYTNRFYSNVFGPTREEHLEMLRQIHLRPKTEIVSIKSITTTPAITK
jgi:hypothetical protein